MLDTLFLRASRFSVSNAIILCVAPTDRLQHSYSKAFQARRSASTSLQPIGSFKSIHVQQRTVVQRIQRLSLLLSNCNPCSEPADVKRSLGQYKQLWRSSARTTTDLHQPGTSHRFYVVSSLPCTPSASPERYFHTKTDLAVSPWTSEQDQDRKADQRQNGSCAKQWLLRLQGPVQDAC